MVKDFLLWRAGKLPKSEQDPDGSEDSSDEMEIMEGTPQEEEAKRNSLILANIMNNLDEQALMSCRLVNRVWYTEATKALYRKSLKVRVKYYPEENDYYRDISHTLKPRDVLLFRPEYTLEHLNYWLDVKSATLPSSSFTFTGGDLAQHHPRKFISTIGSTIKTLSIFSDNIPPSPPFTSKTSFCQLLNQYTPNIEKLELDNGFAFNWTHDELDEGTSLSLPSLKCLTFVYGRRRSLKIRPSDDSVKMLLKAAPNLERLENVSMFHLSVVVNSGKVGIVKGLCDFGEFGACNPQDLTHFADAGPTLEKLYMSGNVNWRRQDLLVDLYKIFESSKSSLELLDTGAVAPHMHIPSLSRLKKLSLNMRCSEDEVEMGWRFGGGSPHFQLTGTDYSNLDTLSLGFCDLSRLFVNPETRQRVFNNIKHFEFQDIWNDLQVAGLSGLCSNLKVLTIDCFRHSRRFYESVFRVFGGGNVEILNINISWARYEQMDLDSVLTGINGDTCEKYFSCQDMEDKESRLFKLGTVRRFPWIGNMENLKELNIYFSKLPINFPRIAKKGRSIPLLTRVSHLCAFDLLPDLKVTVGFDQVVDVSRLEQALESILPLVNVAHWTRRNGSPEHHV